MPGDYGPKVERHVVIHRGYKSPAEIEPSLLEEPLTSLLFNPPVFLVFESYTIKDEAQEDSSEMFGLEIAGREGNGKVTEELLSMRRTEAMFGLSSAFSWTQTRPM